MTDRPDPARHEAALALEAWGIEGGYHDGLGEWRRPGPEVAALLRRSMGAATDDPAERPPAGTPLRIVRPGAVEPTGCGGPAHVELEDGTRVPVGGVLPPDLPLGYHQLEADGPGGPERSWLIVAPERAHLPEDLRIWGLTAQLYAARSRASWGIGDLGDLARLTAWASERGAGAIGLNPLHASTPSPSPANSPYSPSSRRWRDPLYLAVEAIPGAEVEVGGPDLQALVAAGRALNAGDRIDRAAVWGAKRAALEHLWARFPGDPRFDRFRADHGRDLEVWSTFCVLADHHGGGWRSWPAQHQDPEGSAVARFAADHASRLGFWAWLQWLIDEQLAASGAGELAINDLAVGIDPDGADAWQWQELLADGVRIGAPPDPLGRDGQDWGLPPFVPWKARAAGYQPLAQTLRANLRHARGLRIDHVMGLLRLLWIPPGRGAIDGAYVRHHGRELLDIVCLESVRAGAFVVGEDLGTVEPGVRELLAGAGILSTRLLWFEAMAPEAWPAQAMGAVTTHDLPTIAGVWSGVDLEDQRAAGVTLPPDGGEELRHRLRFAGSVDDAATTADVAVAVHRRLADAPSALVTAALDDLVGAEHRPNLPGTIDQHPNWRIPLPVLLDDLPAHEPAERIAAALRSGGR